MLSLLTLNTHSLEENNMSAKQDTFAQWVQTHLPDVIALQEVNQNRSEKRMRKIGRLVCARPEIEIRKDNHALAVLNRLEEKGISYYGLWLPMKIGYDRYDEGLALLSRKPILNHWVILLSDFDEYTNFRTRKALAIETDDGVFISVHMGWWKDGFASQWQHLMQEIALIGSQKPVYLMGDFNADASIPDEGYALMKEQGIQDLYELALEKDDGATVVESIDGWKDQDHAEHMRIDYLLCTEPVTVRSIRTVFNGRQEDVISDHFGLWAQIEPDTKENSEE